MNEIDEKLVNCMDCKAHKVIADPDPYDWFCDDDRAVLCTLIKGNPDYDPKSPYAATCQNEHRCVTVSCRPYNLRKESEIPDWCPKLPQENKEEKTENYV
jgi:hypothetical protein